MAIRNAAAHARLKENMNRFQEMHNDYSHKIGRLSGQMDNLVSEEHALNTGLDKLLKQLKFKSMVSKKVFYGKDSKQQCDKSTQKELYLSQMKLHSRKTRLSLLRHGNRVLKQQITEARFLKNKAVHDAAKLTIAFEKQAQKMAEELDTANGYQNDNLRATTQLQAWVEKSNSDTKEFERECAEKQEILSEFKQREDFVQNAAKRLQQEGEHLRQTGQMSIAEERAVREKMYKLSHNLSNDRRRLLASHEKLISFETAFKILTEHTGEEDVSKIVQIFIDREDECFGIYTFLQRLNTQIQNDETQSIKVHAQIAKYTEELEESKKTNHRLLADVEKKRDILLQKVENSNRQLKDFYEKINLWGLFLEKFLGQALKSEHARQILMDTGPELSRQIESAQKPGARPTSPKGKLARLAQEPTSTGRGSPRLKSLTPKMAAVVNDKNILQTLSLVEALATGIVQIYSATGMEKSLKKLYKFGLPAPPHPRRLNAHVVTRMEIPSFENWFDTDDLGTPQVLRPFSTDMLRKNVTMNTKSPIKTGFFKPGAGKPGTGTPQKKIDTASPSGRRNAPQTR